MSKKFTIEKQEMVNKSFCMPADLVNTLQTVAQDKDISLNYLVIKCCEYAMENLDLKQDKE